ISDFISIYDDVRPGSLDSLAEEILMTTDPAKLDQVRFYHAKVRAASHLMGEYFSMEEIVNAWKNSALRASKLLPLEERADLFLAELFSSLDSGDERKGNVAMFDGYLLSKPYHPEF